MTLLMHLQEEAERLHKAAQLATLSFNNADFQTDHERRQVKLANAKANLAEAIYQAALISTQYLNTYTALPSPFASGSEHIEALHKAEGRN